MTSTTIADAIDRLLAKAMAERREWHPAYWPAHMTPEEQRRREAILRERAPKEDPVPLDPVTMKFLGLAVPLWIDRHRGTSPPLREARAREVGHAIAHHQGVAAMVDPEARGTGKKGGLGQAFNLVAEGLALLAFCPGGVDFCGAHWEATCATS